MKSLAFLTLVLIISCIHLPSSSGRHDYFLMAIQWPSGQCNWRPSPCYLPYPTDFTIHGLWPKLNNGLNPPPRPPLHSDRSLMSVLDRGFVRKLVRVWPQLLNRGQRHPNYEFWAHEWNVHGSAEWSNETAYFNAAMVLFDYLDVKNMLAARRIHPGHSYLGERIQSAAGGLNPNIVCLQDRRGHYVLREIRFCLDGLALPVTCNTTSWYSCGGSKYNDVFF